MAKFHGRLEVTDLVVSIDLLGNKKGAFSLLSWEPSDPDVKGGGIWTDNPLLDGRQPAIRNSSNIVDVFSLNVRGQTQNDIYGAISKLRALLTKGVKHWTDPDRFPSPVYLLIQYPQETEPSYAVIYDFRWGKTTSPFHQPVYSTSPNIEEVALTIERGLRAPITGLCAELDYSYLYRVIRTKTYSPIDDFDDVEVSRDIESYNLTLEPSLIGTKDGDNYEMGICFHGVDIPPGATILNARLKFQSTALFTDTPPAFWVEGERNSNAAHFQTFVPSGLTNYLGRSRTNTRVQFLPNDVEQTWTDGGYYDISRDGGIESVIQEIIDLPGWVSGNKLVLFVGSTKTPVDRYRAVGTYSTFLFSASLIYDPATLEIDYIEEQETISIIDTTCQGAIVGNGEKFNQIDRVFRYDDSAAAFTDLTGLKTFQLFPAAPNYNDLIYFACNFNVIDPTAEPFYGLVFNITVPAAYLSFLWEAYISGSWQAIPDIVDETQGFVMTGVKVIHWTPDENWQTVAVNGVTAFWVRCRIVDKSTVPVPPTYSDPDNLPWTPDKAYIDLPVPSVDNIVSSLRVACDPIGAGASIDAYSIDEIFIGKRAISRGGEFTPFINLGPFSHASPNGISSEALGSVTSVQRNSAPTGYVYEYSVVGATPETDIFQVNIGSQISNQYAGKFKVSLRRYGVTSPQVGQYRLVVSTASGGVTSTFYKTQLISDVSNNPEYTLIDFGIVDLSTLIAKNFERIFLRVSVKATAAMTVDYCDLILFPVDEMLIHAYQRIGADIAAWTICYSGIVPTIDGISGDTLSAYIEKSGAVVDKLLNEGSINFELDSGDIDARLWFLFGTYQSSFINFQRSYSPGIIARVNIDIQGKVI